jgi:hypothetical protein
VIGPRLADVREEDVVAAEEASLEGCPGVGLDPDIEAQAIDDGPP